MPYINNSKTPNPDKLVYVSGLPGTPGTSGEQGPQGPAGPAGVGTELTSTDISLSVDNSTINSSALSLSYLVNLSSPAIRNIAGVTAIISAGGQFPTKQITNTGAFNLTFLHLSGLAIGQNRVSCPNSIDYILYPGKTAYLAYDYNANNWVLTVDSNTINFTSAVTTITNNSTLSNPSLAFSSLVNVTSASDVICIGISSDLTPGNTFPNKEIINTGTFNITFAHQSGLAAVANRVITPNGINFILRPGKAATFSYDFTATRWRLSQYESTVQGLQVIELSANPGRDDGEVKYCNGYEIDGDGGHGEFYWVQGVTSGANGYTKINAPVVSPTGQWRRTAAENQSYRNAKWYGARGNAGSPEDDPDWDDQIPLQACIDDSYGYGAEIYIPYGRYRLKSTLKMRNLAVAGPNYNCKIRGDSHGCFTHGGTQLLWGGPPYNPLNEPDPAEDPTSILFQAGAPDCTFEGIEWADASNPEAPTATRCAVLVNIGGTPAEGVAYNEHMTFRHCRFAGGEYNVVFDYNLVGTGNSQDNSFTDCRLDAARRAHVWLRSSVQPYSTNFYLCYITNFLGPNPNEPPVVNTPYGVGWLCDTDSSSLTIQDCDIQRVAVHCHFNKAPQSTLMLNNHSEVYKKILVSSVVFNTNSTISIISGRYSDEGVGLQSYGPLSSYPADDYDAIYMGRVTPLTIQGCQFNSGYLPVENWFISIVGNDLVSRGNRYPNLRPFKIRDGGYSLDWTKCRARIFSEGDTASDGSGPAGLPAKMPVLKGCANGGGVVSFVTGDFAKLIEFDKEEPHATQFGVLQPLAYRVNLTVHHVSGSFVVPTAYVSSKTKDGFYIVLSATMPASAEIEVSYDIWSGGYNE
jgi:hypothetical protein